MSVNELVMTIQPKVIDHLGINMYTNLHSVISELIANSWDAGSPEVFITVPEASVDDNYEISVKDKGTGMTFEEINALYLQVGRNKREETGGATTVNDRIQLGRKGIGKFAVFGVAKELVLRTVKDGNFTEFSMDIDEIKATVNEQYKPRIISEGSTEEESGVVVTLKKLKRSNPINIKLLREGIATRFTLLSDNFVVYLNEKPITLEDRVVKDVEYEWDIEKLSEEHSEWNLNEEVSEDHPEWKVSGVIRSKKGTIRQVYNRGVAVFARGKLAQEPTFFGATSGKEFAYPYLFGELHAEFLDGENDIISTNRSAVNIESEEGQALFQWGKELMTKISVNWAEKRIEGRTKIITEKPEFIEWFKELVPSERKIARNIFDGICQNENLDEEKIIDLANYVKDSFQYRAFQDLAQEITDESLENTSIIIKLFRNWEHLESREMYRILKGRLAAIDKLKRFIETDALEVPTLHNYLRNFPWLLDPRWAIVYDETYYTKLLREEFNDDSKPEQNRRIDFFCVASWPTKIIVELKRPGHKVNKDDLNQLNEYVDFVLQNLGNDPSSSTDKVYGYMICENEDDSKGYQVRRNQLAENGMYVRKYSDLLSVATRIHHDFIKKYEELSKISVPGTE